MKFGAHSYIFSDRWSDANLPILDTVKELGLDNLEIGVGDDVIFNPVPLKKKAQELGLILTVSPGGLWPKECDLSSENPRDREMGLEYHKRRVDEAHKIGAIAYCGSLYGHTGVIKPHPPTSEEFTWMAEGLRTLAEYSQKKGVAIVLEPMSHFRTYLINRPEQLLHLLSLANHPNLYALLDTYHMVVEVRDYGKAIEILKDHLWGIHACENDRGVPGGGIIPWDSVFAALHIINFDGFIVMETYNSSIPNFAYQRGMFHNLCPDASAFVRQGLKFLKAGLNKKKH